MWNFKKFKNYVALADGNEEVLYKDLDYYSKIIGKKLVKNTLTLILTDNSIDAVICYVSLLKKRFPILILDHKISQKYLKNIIRLYKPKNICLPRNNLAFKVEKFFKLNFHFRKMTFLKDTSKNYVKFKNNISILATTSGSTGSSKLIRQSFNNIKFNTLSILKYLKLKKNYITITNLPLSYTFGMSVINTHLEVGSKIVVTKNTIFEKKFWELFNFFKVNTFYGVPYTFEILDKLKFFSKNKSSLKLFAQAGGKLTENLQKKISFYVKKYKKLFFIMYGQAEATTRISYLPSKKFGKKIGSIGIPLPGGKISLINENNKIIKGANTVGEIMYEGKNVCMGYAHDWQDINKKNQWNYKVLTGDLAKKDKDGYYYIVGRKKRFSKIYGLNVNLDDIENLLKSKFKNVEIAVISFSNKIRIFTSKNILNEKILSYIKKNVNININSFEVVSIHKMPYLINGKHDYKVLSNYR